MVNGQNGGASLEDVDPFAPTTVHASQAYVVRKVNEEAVDRARADDALTRALQTVGADVARKAEATALAEETRRAKDREKDLENRIAALKSFDVLVVGRLPSSGLPNTVYLVPSAKSADLNVKDEYLWLDGAWEQIGSTAVDLTDYARKSEVPRRPEDIGAANATHTHSRSQITDFPTAMNPTAHADTHAAGGDDAITPASIGALTKGDIASKAEAECDRIWVAYKKMLPTRVTEYVAVVVQSDGDPIVAKYIGKPTILNVIPLDPAGAATETVGGTVCDLILRELVGPSGISSYSLEVYDHDTGDQLGSAITTDTPSEVRNAKTVVQSIESRIGGLATEEQVDAVSDKVDDIKSTVSTDNRILVNDTTAAIQTREGEEAEWTNEIRVDKGYDAVQGSTMVKLDKSVQTVTVSVAYPGSVPPPLQIVLPDEVEGTVRDLCLYVNNISGALCLLTFPAGTYYGDDPNGASARAGVVTAVYITEMPGGSWMLRISELEQHTMGATA